MQLVDTREGILIVQSPETKCTSLSRVHITAQILPSVGDKVVQEYFIPILPNISPE